MPAPSPAAGPPPAAPARRLILVPRETRRGGKPASPGPRHYRLARLERTQTSRAERFAHLKRSYD